MVGTLDLWPNYYYIHYDVIYCIIKFLIEVDWGRNLYCRILNCMEKERSKSNFNLIGAQIITISNNSCMEFFWRPT